MNPVEEREASAREALAYDESVGPVVTRFESLRAANAACNLVNLRAKGVEDTSVLIDAEGKPLTYRCVAEVPIGFGDTETPWDWLVARYAPGGWFLLCLHCVGERGVLTGAHIVSPAIPT